MKNLKIATGEDKEKRFIKAGEYFAPHWHDYFEIKVVVQGTGIHYYNGTAYTLEKGDVYLLTPVDFHGIEAEKAIELINVSFDTIWLSEDMRSFLCFV